MSRAAIRYAKAILDIASTNNNAVAVNADMKLVFATIKGNQELKDFLNNPVVKGEMKQNALLEIFPSMQAESKGLLHLLLVNKRFEILQPIASQYNLLFDDASGVETAIVTTAIALTPELETLVMAKLKEFSNKTITIKNVINPEIIGGFVIRIGDKQYNASVANKLQQLKQEFTN